jgi:hypothetical protein
MSESRRVQELMNRDDATEDIREALDAAIEAFTTARAMLEH